MKKFFLLVFIVTTTYLNIYGQQNPKETYYILFVGNSLTYTNNLPKLVTNYAKHKAIQVNTETVAYPNYAIEDHWNDGRVQELIASKKFDYVIIQQGPSSQSEGRKMLIEYGKKYSALCTTYDTKLCFFMVWPSLSYYFTFDGVIKNHTDAASRSNAILLPVGKLWKNDVDTYNREDYYSADGFHPSLKGSQFAAKVIVDYLFKL